jgi:hypothetical protein
MRIDNYLKFILENKKTAKMMIFYSDSFREILQNIWDNNLPGYEVAEFLLGAENSDKALDTYTLIDKTDKNDMISYVQTSRFQREYPEISIEDLELHKVNKGDKFWTQGRTPYYSIGRWIRHIFSDVHGITLDNNKIEEFVTTYKSTYDMIYSIGDYLFEIVRGENIRYWYLESRYEVISGQLGQSCMRYDRCQPYLDIYVENPEVCQLLILKSNKIPGKIIGRALIWTLASGDKYMDRVYTIIDSDKLIFFDYGKTIGVSKNNSNTHSHLKVNTKVIDYDYYPYMDTFVYYKPETGLLSSKEIVDDEVLQLNNTNGTSTSVNERVWSDWLDRYIDVDDSCWCEDINDYSDYENSVYLDYDSYYVSSDANTEWSDYHNSNFLEKDLIYSKCMSDYLNPNLIDLIEFKTNIKGSIDVCPSELTPYYIKIEDPEGFVEYYSKENYIKDVFSDEYHFKDEIIDGVRFETRIEKKIEDELNIKEEYTKKTISGDEVFDIVKYKKDLENLLISHSDELSIREISELIPTSKKYLDNVVTAFLNSRNDDHSQVLRIYDSFIIPGFFAWILRDQSNGYINAIDYNYIGLESYKQLVNYMIEKLDISDIDKKEVYELYSYLFKTTFNTKRLLLFFDSVNISKLPSEIYKRIYYMNM